MQLAKSDIQQFKEAKEYVDTLLIPLVPISLNDKDSLDKIVLQRELMKIFCNEIEKYYTGRIFLLPSYNYLSSGNKEEESNRINEWVTNATTNPFQHIFFLTFDHLWKKHESELNGDLLWFPSITSGDASSTDNQNIIKEQVEQVKQLIKSYW